MGNISFYDHFALVRAGFFLGIQRANVDLAPYNVTLKPVILYGSTALETLRAGIQAVTSYQDLIGVICNGISLSSSDSGVNLYPYLSSLQINTISTFGINSDFIFKGSAPYLFRSFPSIVSVVQNFMKLSNLLGINNIGLIFDPTQISSESIRLANFTSRIIAAAPLSSADAGFPISYTLVYQALFLLKQSGAKAILITYSHFILNFYLAAQDLGMLTNEYTFFILNYFPTSMTPYQWRGCVFYSPLKSKNNAERSKLAAAFGVASTNDSNSMFYDPCFGKSTGGASLGCNVRITFTYDNVVIFSKAILAAIVANQDPSNPDVLRSFIRLTEYIGKNQFRTGFTSNQDVYLFNTREIGIIIMLLSLKGGKT